MHEHRKAERFPITQPVRLTLTRAGSYELEAVSKDVSTKGAFVYVGSEIVERSEIQLRLSLPAEGGSVPVLIRGRVVRIERPIGGKHGVGIAFEKSKFSPSRDHAPSNIHHRECDWLSTDVLDTVVARWMVQSAEVIGN